MKGMGGLSLGELIDKLKRQDRENRVRFDFCGFMPTELRSYRGYYEDLAIGYAQPENWKEDVTVAALLVKLEIAVGKTFTGWKGGHYVADRDVTVWVDQARDASGTAIVDVEEWSGVTILVTRCVDR